MSPSDKKAFAGLEQEVVDHINRIQYPLAEAKEEKISNL